MPKSDEIQDIIDQWNEPYKAWGQSMYDAYKDEFNVLSASKGHHSAFPGGLRTHTLAGVQCVRVLYSAYEQLLYATTQDNLPFTLERAEFVMLIHDFGKIEERDRKPFVPHYIRVFDMLKKQGIFVDDEITNCIFHHHGGWGPSGEMKPLAIFIHSCDLFTSQVIEDV